MDRTYLRRLKDKFDLWHLMYRTEIVLTSAGFIVGFIIGAIIFKTNLSQRGKSEIGIKVRRFAYTTF